MPSIIWMALFLYEDCAIDIHENFQKMSLRNRCHIASPQGRLRMSVPLKHGRNQRRPVADVDIYNEEDWRAHQWKTLNSCYRKSPYFEFFEPETEAYIATSHEHLVSQNLSSIQYILKLLNMEKSITYTDTYIDMRDSSFYPIWLQINKGESPIKFPEYQQVFMDRHGFLPNLSTIDLIYCIGPSEATAYLENIHHTIKKL